MALRSQHLARILNEWPGRERFGIYRFLPLFVLAGATLEFTMVKLRVGEVNFYSVYKRKQAHATAMQMLKEESETSDTSVPPR
jgi:hypothetical protein